MQPPWIAAITGKRALAIALNDSCNLRSCWRNRSRAITSPVLSGGAPSAPGMNTDKSIPAEKCLPVDDSTATRVPPASSNSRNTRGISAQNGRVMLFMRSG